MNTTTQNVLQASEDAPVGVLGTAFGTIALYLVIFPCVLAMSIAAAEIMAYTWESASQLLCGRNTDGRCRIRETFGPAWVALSVILFVVVLVITVSEASGYVDERQNHFSRALVILSSMGMFQAACVFAVALASGLVRVCR
ncbi:hypothetical protein B0A55_02815 [Friedmanniomyces simplex]|uniref:Uncharacterized protein n=1 Tax=Friedmanniomyces simplex TaxID=329884 RepID=A0A4U0XQ10_9PEZI|nr:hypothetical protein B0A55_02815 [Friedmanniomyces simplex]